MTTSSASEPVYTRQLDASSGQLAAQCWSERGPTVVLVHGLGDSSAVWDPLIAYLQDHFRVITLDLLGHGGATHSESGRYTVDAHLDDLRSALAVLCSGPFSLVGHSLGGQLALLLAAEWPERVTQLVLVDSGPELKSEGLEHVRQTIEADLRFSDPADFEQVLRRTYPLADPATLARLARRELHETSRGWARRRDPAVAATTWEPSTSNSGGSVRRMWRALTELTCPTLVVRGLASAVLSDAVLGRMLAMLECGTAAVVERAGHNVMLDHPAELARVVLEFLRAPR